MTEVKMEKHLENSLEAIINNGKEKGNISISTEHPLDDLPITNPILQPDSVEKTDAPLIDTNQKVTSEDSQHYCDRQWAKRAR
ncbi:hypothetical protein A9G22_03540 [Gilliamella sp. App2-1]|uniref:hypothetical protein n=1 Tax=Gilliamella sp. App2-1 TaxID=3120230 RepID=UPI00082799E5|nr:hypothetical protein [Gilliamella apicola]OCG24852.1 hypothetical protein A9G22_03540 [Gilliamella apicola]